ncbi:hypothetical protein CBS101457_003020 [Exobasidium rhododendri]|nr:hypothetical protein CBS101457_003020 [Exobasidium rhododendri]
MQGEASNTPQRRRTRPSARAPRPDPVHQFGDAYDAAPIYDGSQTSRLSGEDRRALLRGRRRDQDHHQHGAGGLYSTTSANEPVMYDFFSQQPEGIAAHNRRGEGAGISSAHLYSYGNMDVPEEFATEQQIDYRVSDFHNNTYPHPHMEGLHSQIAAMGIQQHAQHTHQPLRLRAPTLRRQGDMHDYPLDAPNWDRKNSEARMTLTEIISKHRGLRYEYSRRILKDILTRRLELELLDDDPSVVVAAINNIFPITADTVLPVWKTSLSDDDAEILVDRMRAITGQRKDVVRNYFLRGYMNAQTALELFRSSDECMTGYAVSLGLLPPNSMQDEQGHWLKYPDTLPEHPWQYHLDSRQKARVVDLVAARFHRDTEQAKKVLGHFNVILGYGDMLLQARGTERFNELLDDLVACQTVIRY